MMRAKINRYLWMGIFFTGLIISVWLEWLARTASPMAWFLLTGVWSAVCGIGFTISSTFLKPKTTRSLMKDTQD